MSWWSYRVSIQFSLLCLILLTDFHKNAHFRPNMLNNLNMTFTFGKQTKDNFMKRKFKSRPTVAVDCTALNYWGKHKRKMATTNRKATSSSRAPSTSSLYYYDVALSLYRDKRITIIRLWWRSQWLVTYRHHLAVTIYLHVAPSTCRHTTYSFTHFRARFFFGESGGQQPSKDPKYLTINSNLR